MEGLKLAQAGNCTDAVVKLERAEKLYHSAVVASRLGECYVSLGRLVEGTEILRRVLREPQPADAAPQLTKALDRAQRALDSAKPRIAGVSIKVAAVEQLSVKMDGNTVPTTLLETEIPSDPGDHVIEASAPGFIKASTRISVAEAEKKTVTLTLTRDPNAAVAVAASPTTASVGPTAASQESSPASSLSAAPAAHQATPPNRTGAYLAFGAGAAGVAVGGVLGFMTMKQREDLKTSCPGDVCPPAQQGSLDSARRLGTFSTVAFGVGAAGLVLGTVLLVTSGSSSSTADHAAAPAKRRAGLARLSAGVGPGSLQVSGEF